MVHASIAAGELCAVAASVPASVPAAEDTPARVNSAVLRPCRAHPGPTKPCMVLSRAVLCHGPQRRRHSRHRDWSSGSGSASGGCSIVECESRMNRKPACMPCGWASLGPAMQLLQMGWHMQAPPAPLLAAANRRLPASASVRRCRRRGGERSRTPLRRRRSPLWQLRRRIVDSSGT